MKLIICLAALMMSGCSLTAELAHTSHPLRGAPFGPAQEEDTLNLAQLCGRKQYARVFVEHCLGYQLTVGGFYGDDFIYTGRFGVRIFGRE